MPKPDVVLEAKGLAKSFGPVEAVVDVDLIVKRGQILAIVGDNGAGKSTLTRMLSGGLAPDRGSVVVDGELMELGDPAAARQRGIEMVYQDLALADNLDVVSNFLLGREPVRGGVLKPFGVLDRKEMVRSTQDALTHLAISIPYVRGVAVERLSGGQRQSVAVARAIQGASRVLIMDEPTAALGVAESRAVLGLVKKAAADGIAVILISHILPHVVELADAIVVMRHGRVVSRIDSKEEGPGTERHLVELIVGIEAGGAP